MWIFGLLLIVCLTFAGYFTVALILWDLYQEGKRGDRELEEHKKRGKQREDWEAYLDKRFPK